MRKLTYWIADILGDSPAYSIRGRTKREVTERRNECVTGGGRYGPPRKVTVEFADTFDLLQNALGEGGLNAEQIKRVY